MDFDVVIFHAHCPDGTAAAWPPWRECPKKKRVEFYKRSHGQPPPDVAGKKVLIVDFCFSREVMESIAIIAKSILVLDHHNTSIRVFENFPHPNVSFLIDEDRSGAQISWDYFYPGVKRPWFIDVIGDRDLWKWEIPYSKPVSKAMFVKGWYTWEKFEELMAGIVEPARRDVDVANDSSGAAKIDSNTSVTEGDGNVTDWGITKKTRGGKYSPEGTRRKSVENFFERSEKKDATGGNNFFERKKDGSDDAHRFSSHPNFDSQQFSPRSFSSGSFSRRTENRIEYFTRIGTIYLEQDDKEIHNACSNAYLTKLVTPKGEEYTVKLTSCPSTVRSDVGNRLASSGCDFAAIYTYDFLLNEWWVSLRSKTSSPLNLSLICEQFKRGGGHCSSANFAIFGNDGESLHTYFKIINFPSMRGADYDLAVDGGTFVPRDRRDSR